MPILQAHVHSTQRIPASPCASPPDVDVDLVPGRGLKAQQVHDLRGTRNARQRKLGEQLEGEGKQGGAGLSGTGRGALAVTQAPPCTCTLRPDSRQ